MATYYVRKGGNDTTGDGSTGNPWLTLGKALTIAVATDTVNMGDGTYVEGGAGSYLAISKNLADWLTIQAENGATGAVTITGNGSGSGNVLITGTTSHVRFKYLTFGMAAGSGNSAFRINAAANNLDFEYCTFTPIAGANAVFYVVTSSFAWASTAFTGCTFNAPATPTNFWAISSGVSGTGTISGITFTGCAFHGGSYGCVQTTFSNCTFDTCSFDGTASAIVAYNSPANVTITNCSFANSSYAIWCNGGSNWIVNGGVVNTYGAGPSLTFGFDGASGNATSVTITGMTITHPIALSGHALLMGAGCIGCVVNGVNVVSAYDYAIVVKEHTGTEIKNCVLNSGSSAALYYKAATSPNAHDNILIANRGYCFQLLKGDSGDKSLNWTLRNNSMRVRGNGAFMNIGTSTDDAGGGVCDYNRYSGRSWGALQGTAIASLGALRTQWAAYGGGSNDSHSSVVKRSNALALMAVMR